MSRVSDMRGKDQIQCVSSIVWSKKCTIDLHPNFYEVYFMVQLYENLYKIYSTTNHVCQ